MNKVIFLLNFAKLQKELGGVGGFVRPIDIQRASDMPRTTVYRYLKEFVSVGIIRNPKYGKYKLSDCEHMKAVGCCVLTTMDIIEYQSTQAKRSGIWSQ